MGIVLISAPGIVSNDFIAEEFEAVEALGRISLLLCELSKLPGADGIVRPYFSVFEDDKVLGLISANLRGICPGPNVVEDVLDELLDSGLVLSWGCSDCGRRFSTRGAGLAAS